MKDWRKKMGDMFDEFHLDWLMDREDQLSNHEFDEYFYDATSKFNLK